MSSYLKNNNWCISGNVWRYWLILILAGNSTHSQEFLESTIVYVGKGTQYSPANMAAQLLSTTSTSSLKMCAIACNANVLCRILDFGVNLPQQCRLFEGDTTTMGTITSSSSSNSTVGIVQISADLFTAYGLACLSACQQNRYLTCSSNSTCQCMPHSYWNGSMCVAQTTVLGAPCQQNMSMCREDMNYTCLPINQCGPPSVFAGTTIADQNTVISGSPTVGLSLPVEIITDAPVPGFILVVDAINNQVVRLSDDNSSSNNNYVVASTWIGGNQLYQPYDIFFDTTRGNNLYVSDSGNNRVVMFTAMQSAAPIPKIVAGVGGVGIGTNQLSGPRGIVIDRQGNLIVADCWNNRVILYAPNATNGTMIIGSGAAGNDSRSLRNPISLFLDESNSWLYVTDTYNNRIQRFALNSTLPLDGTTVAGGNGAGTGSNQLNLPSHVWVSNKTGSIYIADSNNHRIQLWSQGAASGFTIAGNSNGISGTNATMLKSPLRIAVNTNETFLYVSDSGNSRVQRFQLI